MTSFEFKQKNGQLQAISQKIFQLETEPLIQERVKKLQHELEEKERSELLRIAVCGQYSAGKSSLIQALTGDSSIQIGQDVTTDQVQIYRYKGVEIADTPGICAGRPEHDVRSLDCIRKADLLIYMITIQGFTREIGKNFKKLMEQYVNKTMLVMNKRNQEPAENEAHWRRDTSDFVGSETLQKLYFSIIDVEDYICAEREKIPELKEESHFEEFVTNLNLFIKEKGLIGKVVSRINLVEKFLTDSMEAFSKKQQEDIFSKRQLDAVSAALRKCHFAASEAKSRMVRKIKDLKHHLVGLISNETLKEFETEMNDVEDKLQEIWNDEQFSADIQAILEELEKECADAAAAAAEYEAHRKELGRDFNQVSVDSGVDLSLLRSGAMELSQLVGNVTKEGLVKLVHLIGIKFKPWQAIKLTKFIKGLGPWLTGLGVVIEVVSIALDKEQQAQMEKARRELGEAFDDIGQNVATQFETMIAAEDSPFSKLKDFQNKLLENKKKQEEENAKKAELVVRFGEWKEELAALKADL